MDSHSKLRQAFETAGGLILYVLFLAISVGFLVAFLKGAAFLSQRFIPLLSNISGFVFWFFLLVGVPLSLIKRLRGVMAVVFLIGSYIFGLTTWLIGFAITYFYWGIFWVIIGLFLAGVGVVPFGLVASVFHHDWGGFWTLVVMVGLTYGTRFYAHWLATSYENYLERRANPSQPYLDLEPSAATFVPSVPPPFTTSDVVVADTFSVSNINSVLLVGETGSGKTYMVKSLFYRLMENYSAEQINFVIFDLKQVEFINAQQDFNYAYLLKDIVHDPKMGLRVLQELVELIDLRIKKQLRFPAIVIYIEECDMAMIDQTTFDHLVLAILAKASAANVCLIYATSRISSQTISKKLLNAFDEIIVGAISITATKYLGVPSTKELPPYAFIRFDNDERDTLGNQQPVADTNFEQQVGAAIKVIAQHKRASTAMLQRELQIGYGQAVRIIEQLEAMGIVDPADGSRPRKVNL